MRRHVARMGVMRTEWVCDSVVGKSDRNRTLGWARCRQEDNIKMHLKEIVWKDVDSIDLVNDRVQRRTVISTAMVLWVPHNAGNWNSWVTSTISSRSVGGSAGPFVNTAVRFQIASAAYHYAGRPLCNSPLCTADLPFAVVVKLLWSPQLSRRIYEFCIH